MSALFNAVCTCLSCDENDDGGVTHGNGGWVGVY